MEKEVKRSFIEYSMSVIAARALPDVRDGMKPGQRRIMYAMYEDNLTYDKPFRKSATTVGNVLGRYHPHGDSAVYGTMVRMAQDFSYRYPLIEGHGNFGSVDGDDAAAYRYTEARMAKISDYLMADLEKEVVDFVPNFDNRRREPKVLPSRFPNLLVNGAMGIAVGMATNIPPHNLGEVIDATVYRMDNPESTVPELMEYIKGPDFPTYATIYGTQGILQAYTTGRGRVMVRAKATIEEDKHRIIFTEIPYGVNKSELCKAIAGLHKDKRIEGITDLRDESGRNGMRIVVEYRRDANAQVILNQLYKYSQLEDTCAVNMLALVNNEPKVLSLPQILDLYIEHQKSVIYRRVNFDLEKARAKAHIFEGYHIATDNIDRIVEIMKSSKSIPEAKERLMSEFFTVSYKDGFESELGNVRQLSDAQAQAIVDMTLGKLTGMEREKIEEELARLHALITELEGILADPAKVAQIIKDEMSEIKRKFGDERRTEILPATDDIDLEDLIEKHECVITLTKAGYIKRRCRKERPTADPASFHWVVSQLDPLLFQLFPQPFPEPRQGLLDPRLAHAALLRNIPDGIGAEVAADEQTHIPLGKCPQVGVDDLPHHRRLIFHLGRVSAQGLRQLGQGQGALGGNPLLPTVAAVAVDGDAAGDLGEKRLETARALGRDGVPGLEVSVVETFLAVLLVLQNVVGHGVEIPAVLAVGLADGGLVPIPVQVNNDLVGGKGSGVGFFHGFLPPFRSDGAGVPLVRYRR